MSSLFLLSGVTIFLFVIFQKKKTYLIKRQILEKKNFDNEIINLQIEIREQTLRNISWELHDNIGQMLTLAKIQLQTLEGNATLDEAKNTLGNALQEVRALSKSINPEFLKTITLFDAVDLEITRFNRLNFIKSDLRQKGETFKISKKVEIVLFRILQEFFTNTIKHSQAKELEVSFEFTDENLSIIATENGIGFNLKNFKKNGIGISNIQKRGKLINAEITIESEIGKGSTLTINYKKQRHEKI